MRRNVLALLSLFFLLARSASARSTDETAQRIIDAELAQSRAFETLSYLTDHIGPRLSGSKGAELAVQWTTKRFREWGIDVRNEKVMVPHWVRGAERASLPSHNDLKIVLTALGGSTATPASGMTAEVVEAASWEELEKLGKSVAGKIVYYHNPMDMGLVEGGHSFEAYRKAVEYRADGASRAAQLGAVASLIRSVGSASLRTPHTGSVHYDPKVRRIPAAALALEDADLLHRLLGRGERVRMHLVLTPRTLPDAQSANVIAEIRGTEAPHEIVVIGAHLDSWDLATGAIDDGSGVAMVMETMRLLKELGLQPKRTIRAVLFMNEENGVRGGKAYFEGASKREELSHHVAVIETDAGADTPIGFDTTLDPVAFEAFRPRVRVLERIAPMRYESSRHVGSDTSPLVDAGVPGFGLVPDPRHYFDYHHSPADTLDKVDPHKLAQNSAAVAALAWILAEEGL